MVKILHSSSLLYSRHGEHLDLCRDGGVPRRRKHVFVAIVPVQISARHSQLSKRSG